MNKKVFLVLLLITALLCLLGASYFALLPEEKKNTFANAEDQTAYDKWSNLIKKIGGAKAYQEFKIDTKKRNTRDRHYQAHLFGEALYYIEGINGISVCDNEFDSGCYHSILGVAINNEGLEVVPGLSLRCINRPQQEINGCQHGIGHGVLSSVGYDLANLHTSIKTCRDLDVSDEYIDSCLHGVFMEYNFQTMLLDEGKMRDFDENDPYSPCLSIDEKAQGTCINQLAQWWTDSFKMSFEEKAKKVDTLCQRLKHKDQCYMGFGIKLMVQLNYNGYEANNICNLLTGNQSQMMCQSGVKSHIPS